MLYCKVILRRQSKQRMLLHYSVIQIQYKCKYNRMQIQIQCCIGREATSFPGNIPIVGCPHIAACYKNNSTCINDAQYIIQYITHYNQYAPSLPIPNFSLFAVHYVVKWSDVHMHEQQHYNAYSAYQCVSSVH